MCDSKIPAETFPTGTGRDAVEFALMLGLIALLLLQASLLVATIL